MAVLSGFRELMARAITAAQPSRELSGRLQAKDADPDE
jgi:hypothetical protein